MVVAWDRATGRGHGRAVEAAVRANGVVAAGRGGQWWAAVGSGGLWRAATGSGGGRLGSGHAYLPKLEIVA